MVFCVVQNEVQGHYHGQEGHSWYCPSPPLQFLLHSAFSHSDSVTLALCQKTLMLRKIEGRRRRVQQRMRWLDDISNSMDMSLSKLRVGDGQGGLACCSPWGRRVRHDWVTELNYCCGTPNSGPLHWTSPLHTPPPPHTDISITYLLIAFFILFECYLIKRLSLT